MRVIIVVIILTIIIKKDACFGEAVCIMNMVDLK